MWNFTCYIAASFMLMVIVEKSIAFAVLSTLSCVDCGSQIQIFASKPNTWDDKFTLKKSRRFSFRLTRLNCRMKMQSAKDCPRWAEIGAGMVFIFCPW